jgi:hypothetical protein
MSLLSIALVALVQAAPEGHSFSGVVRGADGTLAAGVAVWLASGSTRDGKVPALAKATTDEAGRFRLDPPPEREWPRAIEPPSVWAYKPGGAVTCVGVRWPPSPGSREVALTLGTAEGRSITVLGPDGKPMEGARVVPYGILPPMESGIRAHLMVPDELGDRLAVTTDAAGACRLTGLARSAVAIFRIEAPGLGVQYYSPREDGRKPIALKPVGRVVGRVVADDPAATRGVAVVIGTQFDGGEIAGSAAVTTDDQGRFEVPALAAGQGNYQVHVPDAHPYRAAQAGLRPIEAGRRNEVEIPLRRAVRLNGIVRERGTNAPVAGARVMIGGQYQFEVARSDESGAFSCLVLPGEVTAFVWPWGAPRPFFPLPLTKEPKAEIPAGAKEFTLPPIELSRGETLRGTVVDERGRPAPGARVEGQVMHGPWGTSVSATADASGAFALDDLDPSRTGLRIEASTPVARTAAAVEVSPRARGPIELKVRPEFVAAPTGRVVDRSGAPVAGVEVEVWEQAFEGAEPIRLAFGGGPTLRTGPDGSYRVPRGLRIDHRYRAEARAEGRSPSRTDWTRFRPGQAARLPDLVLGRARAIEGRIADRQGKPIAGAVVRVVGEGPQRPRATTDDLGHFRLVEIETGPAFLFAEAKGFRFLGRALDPSTDSADLVLVRDDEPAAPLATLPPALPAAEEMDLARKLIEPEVAAVLAGGRGQEGVRTLELLARIDPPRALELVEKAKLPDPWMRDAVKWAVARRLLREGPEEAIEIIESLGDPMGRAMGYLKAEAVLPDSERAKKIDRLSQALLHARVIKDAEFRLVYLGQIAGRLLALGEADRGKALLREGRDVAKGLPLGGKGGFARGSFAEDLALDDPAAALELAKGLTDVNDRDRHFGNIAHRLAARDPAAAARAWGMLQGAPMRDLYAVRVCYRMAPKDLARARGIAAKVEDPCQRAYALGVMALALADSDKPAANRLLDEAYAGLVALAESGKDRFNNYYNAPTVAAGLLPTVERVDPGRLSEFLWRTVALRPPRADDEREEVGRLSSDAATAMLVSRYDREAARALIEPALARIPGLVAGGAGYLPDVLLSAPAVVDPRRAASLVDGLPDQPDPRRGGEARSRARRLVARMLATHGDERERRVIESLGLWVVDTYDIAGDD